MKHNRACPKCGAGVVGVIFGDVKPEESPYTDMGTACSECDWEVQLRSSNP